MRGFCGCRGTAAPAHRQKIVVQINEGAYLSGAGTSDVDISVDEIDLALDCTEQDITRRLTQQIFHKHVSKDCISVEWVKSAM